MGVIFCELPKQDFPVDSPTQVDQEIWDKLLSRRKKLRSLAEKEAVVGPNPDAKLEPDEMPLFNTYVNEIKQEIERLEKEAKRAKQYNTNLPMIPDTWNDKAKIEAYKRILAAYNSTEMEYELQYPET